MFRFSIVDSAALAAYLRTTSLSRRSFLMVARRFLLFLALFVFAASVRGQGAAGDPFDRIGPAMQKFIDSRDIAGSVTVVGRADGIKHHAAIGYRDVAANDPMAKDTLFRIASMTKPITAI